MTMTNDQMKDLYHEYADEKAVQRKRDSDHPILRLRTGSHLYGLNTPTSDEDFASIFIPSKDSLLGLGEVTQVLVQDEVLDETRYPLHLFIKHCLKNNPNMLEILHAPDNVLTVVMVQGQELLDNKQLFLSKNKCYNTFLGYARSQRKKLTFKRERMEGFMQALEKVKGWQARGHYTIPETLRIGSELNDKGFWRAWEKGTDTYIVYAKLVEELEAYGWRKELIEKYGYDTKFASHLIRILEEGIDLLDTGKISFPLRNFQYIKDVREGKFKLNEILEASEELELQLEKSFETSQLQDEPDYKAVNDLLVRMTYEWWDQVGY